MSDQALQIIFVEDSRIDMELEEFELRKGGFRFTSRQIETPEELVEALKGCRPDLIISDYSLPRMDGLTALRIAQERCPDIPFIFVSGTLGEERAVQSLQQGATDYVVKERLGRLSPAVRRALQEARERRAHRKLEEQLLQAQKMEAIGRLTGGVAHDFNNLLTVIQGYGELLLTHPALDSLLRDHVAEILKAGQRAAWLTRRLLSFARKEVLQKRILDLNAIVADVDKMLRRIIGENIVLTNHLSPRIPRIKGDPGQLEQVILNLAINARDAMPRGGSLSIETAEVWLEEANLRDHPGAAPGPYVRLAVRDTGIGITPEVRAHLFEPFFTTKPPGQGTGMGLSMVHAIVTQSGGHLTVDSAPGHGTVFNAFFPRTDETPAEEPVPAAEPSVASTGTETILLVEDEEIVRKLARNVLASKGYSVLEAPGGSAALSLCERHPGRINLVIVDVMLPEMTGRELAVRLKEKLPGVGILFVSGYAEDDVLRKGSSEPAGAFLAKPYSPAHLLGKVREVIDART
jgi:two-component system, cell cycle sensor histidine kinase and response regulator CckA